MRLQAMNSGKKSGKKLPHHSFLKAPKMQTRLNANKQHWVLVSSAFALFSAPAYSETGRDKSGDLSLLDTPVQSHELVSQLALLKSSEPVVKQLALVAQADQKNTTTALTENLVFNQLDKVGRVWISEVPSLLNPQLSIAASPLVAIKDQKIAEPISFKIYSNYTAFIDKAEVIIFASNDPDRIKAVHTIAVPLSILNNQITVSWNGQFNTPVQLKEGEYLAFKLRVYDKDGRWDETVVKELRLVSEQEKNKSLTQLKNVSDLNLQLKSQERGLTLDDYLVEKNVFAQNSLAIQNIPVVGSIVKLRGQDIEPGFTLQINQQSVPIDSSRQFVMEYLLPIGEYSFNIEAASKTEKIIQTLKTKISGEHFFMVGLADLTYSENTYSGAIEAVTDEDYQRFTGNHTDGRLAFYLKAKIKGKYLLTAQADTQEKELKDIAKNFFKADRTDLFRRIDPDLYYPIYGDDSVPLKEVDTSGRLFVRLDWDKSYVNWGNVRTEFDSNKLASFNRNLYGGKLVYRSLDTNPQGEPTTQLQVFGAEQQTAPGRSELLGTGGSLYYLRHTDVVPGSEKIVLELRDARSERVENRFELKAGRDYEMDAFQGRIILSRPLLQITQDNLPQQDLSGLGLENILVAQYEYYPNQFDASNYTSGIEAKQWLGRYIAVGANYVKENRSGQDFELSGVDLTLQAGAGSWLKLEQAQSKSSLAPRFFSTDGGLRFNEISSVNLLQEDSGQAQSIEGRLNTQELGLTQAPWKSAFWIKEKSANFSSEHSTVSGKDSIDKGLEIVGQVNSIVQVLLSYKSLDNKRLITDASTQTISEETEHLETRKAGLIWNPTPETTLSAQLENVLETNNQKQQSEAGLLGLRVNQKINDRLDIFLAAQKSFAHQNYANNDAYSIGSKVQLNDASSASLEYTDGDRGQALTAAATYAFTPKYSIFGTYSYSPQQSSSSALDQLVTSRSFTEQTAWSVGQRLQVSEKVRAVTETQVQEQALSSSVLHNVGLEYSPIANWNLAVSMQDGQVNNKDSNNSVHRQSVSISAAYTDAKTEWATKLEHRADTPSDQPLNQSTQWVATNRLTHKVGDDLRLIAKINYSIAEQDNISSNIIVPEISEADTSNITKQAQLIDASLGFAWRPITGRWSVLAKYGYIYDLAPVGQTTSSGANYDQESHIASIEANYEVNSYLDTAAKLAQRQTSTRLERGKGAWFSNNATYAAAQVRLKLRGFSHFNQSSMATNKKSNDLWNGWSVLSEYRMLKTENDGVKKGALVSIEKDINQYQKISVGYNFTDFSSDLSQLSYKSKGFFINFVGRF